jgi:2-polyprenyl-3-methyl-5-hydroxy-6-metoxy-1,4-benzoquinol methylase
MAVTLLASGTIMHIDLAPERVEKFHAAMGDLEPWMHHFRFGPETIVGKYPRDGLRNDHTWCNPESDGELIALIQKAYEVLDSETERKFFSDLIKAVGIDPSQSSILDISSATGKFSFFSADLGFKKVYSSEIRPHQCEQQKLILECAKSDLFRSKIAVSNDTISADSREFAGLYADKDINVVLSIGLLYHLANPIQHLLNCKEIARDGVIVGTQVHFSPYSTAGWVLKAEDPSWYTQAVDGISWTPHYMWLPLNAKRLGFKSCKVFYPKSLQKYVPGYAGFSRSQRLRFVYHQVLERLFGLQLGLKKASVMSRRSDWPVLSFSAERMYYVLSV